MHFDKVFLYRISGLTGFFERLRLKILSIPKSCREKSVPIGKTRFIRSLIMLRNTLRPALRTSKIVIRTSKQSADRGSAVHTHFKNRNAYIVNRTSKRSPPAYQHPQFQRFYHLRRLRAEVAAGHIALFWRDRI